MGKNPAHSVAGAVVMGLLVSFTWDVVMFLVGRVHTPQLEGQIQICRR